MTLVGYGPGGSKACTKGTMGSKASKKTQHIVAVLATVLQVGYGEACSGS